MTILDNVSIQFTIAWLLQFSTIKSIVISIYHRYYNLRRLLLQFTTGITIHDRTNITFRELKHQRRRRLRKRHLKVDSRCLKLYSAYSISKNLANVRWPIFVELNSKGLYQSLGKVQESCFFVCSHPRQNVKLCIFTM